MAAAPRRFRGIRERLAVQDERIFKRAPTTHPYKPFGEPELLECQATRWIEPIELREYRFPPANESLIEEVIRQLTMSAR